MTDHGSQGQKAQLDKAEREHLEDVVADMRGRVEANVEHRLTQRGLDDEPDSRHERDGDTKQLVEAIELEAVDGQDWDEAFEQYVTGVGYTLVNRLAALRCMEVRGFLDEEVTVFKDDGLTPAAETLVREEFLLEGEALLQAYHDACDAFAAEIEILFDRSSVYSQVDPDQSTFEDLCELLDAVPDAVWRADDVLGWVYEYYNRPNLADVRERAHSGGGLGTDDIGVANQFYTPHWVVRMLTDNSLGKLYLETRDKLAETIRSQDSLTAGARKRRSTAPSETPTVSEFCTYLVPSDAGETPTFDHPAEIRVIDPACGSGHFLLYAFDVLERIWRAETDLDHAEIPREILRHNLHGVDLDMRACQLTAFNLYLKGRTRAEREGADGFDMPDSGIVCADAAVAELDGVEDVFDEVAKGREDVETALRTILDAFEDIHGLGSLLDVRGTLGELFEASADGTVQLTLGDDPREDHTLGQVLRNLREAVDERTDDDSFLARDLRSFVRLLDVLAREYDVALMNPPYGSGKRMPDSIQRYLDEQYEYYREFYINFFEACYSLAKDDGRIGMLVPWTLMFKPSFQEFREDFIGNRGAFDFLAEYGYGVLDNATVGTVGTVVRKSARSNQQGEFIRLHDVAKGNKEGVFTDVISGTSDDVRRYYSIDLNEFSAIPGTPMIYSIPRAIRTLHDTELKLDPGRADIDGTGIADAVQGLATSNNDRFVRYHWECDGDSFRPYAKGGADAWVLPQSTTSISWERDGTEIQRLSSSRFQNERFYMREGLTWTYIKRTGRRFGYMPETIFDVTGSMLFPDDGYSPWRLLSVLNSTVYHGLFLSLTPERDWQMGVVGRIPWHEALDDAERLEEIARAQYVAVATQKSHDPRHPLYVAPRILPTEATPFYPDSEHIARHQDVDLDRMVVDESWPIGRAARVGERDRRRSRRRLEKLADRADEVVADALDIPPEVNDAMKQEIFLRTSEEPDDRTVPDPDSVPETPDDIEQQVTDLVHHFAMDIVRETSDGIVPVEAARDRATMLDRIVDRFHDVYEEHAEDRLVEVDDVLGARSATDEAYPNLRAFIAQDLFDYHVDRMEKTPILWRLTTERLIADSVGEGFACFLDYHSLDSGTFDRLSTRYLEPRKAELRERRSAANRRRSDDSLPAREQAAAAETYEHCASGLDQIGRFEDVLQELGRIDERDFDDAGRRRAEELAPKVAAFRETTRERVETLAKLRERNGEAWFKDAFSDTFWETVDEWREEWLDALDELEYACSEYAAPVDEPVEAHLADLFDYFGWRLKGSDHYSSTGILFMTYYFEREGADFLDADGQPHDNLTADERLLASLGMGLDSSVVDETSLEAIADDEGVDDVDELPPLAEFKALAEDIDDRCQAVDKHIPSNWADRALSEITTAGYQPNRKYGVEINITPLADAEIVPKTVDDDVL
ncbi:BREX-5 system adenine-specific DNA-methyltransferase PglX [Haloplanus pelagicus]|uniref:BREX-5 system adenine-specific DNA-methyltransferase PglX n=1 Tax=Haloplanus pelagicus TaxID=2949995 RepID=UPI00203A79D8|nr:BREX-5 system adenine-specific DNA-methyltransferase PglX [Haloplanus sp. HW8-1]